MVTLLNLKLPGLPFNVWFTTDNMQENETKESCTSAHPGCTSLTTSTYSRTGGMEVEEIIAGCVRKGCTGDETAPAPKGTVGMSHQRQDKNQES